MQLLGLFHDSFVPEDVAGVKGVELESKGPSFGVLIVVFKDVAA